MAFVRVGNRAVTATVLLGAAALSAACASGDVVSSSSRSSGGTAASCGTAMLMSYTADSEAHDSPQQAIEAFADFAADAADDDSARQESAADRRAVAVAAEALADDPQQGPGSSYEARGGDGAYLARALFMENADGEVNIATFVYPSLVDGCDDIGAYRP